MPDILIRGIKKPERCFICPLKYNRGMNYYCTIKEMQGVDSCISKNTMSVVCPFSELPPHGDLIEAEPIKRFITDGLNRKEFGYDQIQVLTEIEYAPVIVPASEVTTNG